MNNFKKKALSGLVLVAIVVTSGFTYVNAQNINNQYNNVYQDIYTQFQENKYSIENLTFLNGKDDGQKVYDQYLELQSKYFLDTQTLEANSLSLSEVKLLQEEVTTFFSETNTLLTTKADEKVKSALKTRDEVKVHEHANDAEKTNFSNAKKTKIENFADLSMNDKIKTIKSLQSETTTLNEQYKTVQARVEEEARLVAEAEAYAYAQSQASNYSNNYSSGGNYNNNYNSSGSSNGGNNNYTPAPTPPANNDWNTPPCGVTNPDWGNANGCYESF